MQLTHKIALKANESQMDYFNKAAGTSRFVWNWGLTAWNKLYLAGEKPNAMALKKLFNSIKYQTYPWLKDMHRDSHSQPFTYLGKAWKRFFNELKSGKQGHVPQFKKKGKVRDAFYVANDKFWIEGHIIYLPKIGCVTLAEELRYTGKILGATVSRTANRWFVAIQVDVPENQSSQMRIAHETVGVDFGIKAAATLSTGEIIISPKPLKSSLRRLKIRGRAVSRKIEAAKKIKSSTDKYLPLSNNRKKSSLKLAKLHAHIANLRADFSHKLTTRLCRENQAIVIEDLHVAGMLKNEKLARSISDIGFGRLRRQLEYKAIRYNTKLIVAGQWYPSSRLCSTCQWKNTELTLNDRYWRCQVCGIHHDRDINAALNLKRLATETALPVANYSVTNHTSREIIST